MVRKSEDMFSHYDRIPASDRQKERRTDIHLAIVHTMHRIAW